MDSEAILEAFFRFSVETGSLQVLDANFAAPTKAVVAAAAICQQQTKQNKKKKGIFLKNNKIKG